MTDLARQLEPVNAAIASLASRIDDVEESIQAQLDRIEALLIRAEIARLRESGS